MEMVSGGVVSIWYVPVALSVVLPLLFLCIWLTAKFPAYLEYRSEIRRNIKMLATEKRVARRIHTNEMRVDVSNGDELFTGVVCNISKMGICIMGLPEHAFFKESTLDVIVDDQGERYPLQISLRWEKVWQSGKRIGAAIESVPGEWLEFVTNQGTFSPAGV